MEDTQKIDISLCCMKHLSSVGDLERYRDWIMNRCYMTTFVIIWWVLHGHLKSGWTGRFEDFVYFFKIIEFSYFFFLYKKIFSVISLKIPRAGTRVCLIWCKMLRWVLGEGFYVSCLLVGKKECMCAKMMASLRYFSS